MHAGIGRGHCVGDGTRAVGRAVVDDQHVPINAGRVQFAPYRRHEGLHRLTLVVGGHADPRHRAPCPGTHRGEKVQSAIATVPAASEALTGVITRNPESPAGSALVKWSTAMPLMVKW